MCCLEQFSCFVRHIKNVCINRAPIPQEKKYERVKCLLLNKRRNRNFNYIFNFFSWDWSFCVRRECICGYYFDKFTDPIFFRLVSIDQSILFYWCIREVKIKVNVSFHPQNPKNLKKKKKRNTHKKERKQYLVCKNVYT